MSAYHKSRVGGFRVTLSHPLALTLILAPSFRPHVWKIFGAVLGVLINAGFVWPGSAAELNFGQLSPTRGEFGASLRHLRMCYFPPVNPGESNYYIEMSDMTGGGSWREFLRTQGLTNNHALIVASHGKAIQWAGGKRYAYYPDKPILTRVGRSYFSGRDLAALLGPAASEIDNIVIAGCDKEGLFDPGELRHYFVNATNIIHAPKEKIACRAAFENAFKYHSQDIKFLFEMPDTFTVGHFEARTNSKAMALVPYVASLYRPGAFQPYRTQTAGRELLKPDTAPALTRVAFQNRGK